MPHFKNIDGQLFWLDESDVPKFKRSDWVVISDAEAETIRNPPPTPEQQREQAKVARAEQVAAITVTTAAGHTFDGDEVAQQRMDRAAGSLRDMTARLAAGNPIALPPEAASVYRVVDGAYEMIWVLSDNSVVYVGADEFAEAKALAGAAQAVVWVI